MKKENSGLIPHLLYTLWRTMMEEMSHLQAKMRNPLGSHLMILRGSPPSHHTTPHLQQDPASHLHPLILHFLALQHQGCPIRPSSRHTWLHEASPSRRVSR